MVNFRDMLPKQAVDAMAMSFTFFMIPATYLYGLFYVCPTLYPITDVSEEMAEQNRFPYYFHWCFCTFLFVQTYFSLIMTVVTDTSCRRIALPVVSQPGWYFCPHCQYYAPPRSHHCSICKRCVLRRDHHCYFVGKCIGYYNHRYFISFLVYVVFTGFYGLVFSCIALLRLMGGFSLSIIPSLVFPMLAWIFQIMPINPLVMFETSIIGFVTMGAGVLLGIQVFELFKGQTFYELQKKEHGYSRALYRNIADVLGKNWLFGLMFPCLPSSRIGDGSHYKPKNSGQGDGALGAPNNQATGGGTRKMVQRT